MRHAESAHQAVDDPDGIPVLPAYDARIARVLERAVVTHEGGKGVMLYRGIGRHDANMKGVRSFQPLLDGTHLLGALKC